MAADYAKTAAKVTSSFRSGAMRAEAIRLGRTSWREARVESYRPRV